MFKGDRKLEACLLQDPAHVFSGAVGSHVSKIQTALAILDNADIKPAEIAAMKYDTSTADAVLAYKRKRNIINYSYQTQADNIVGKMTIASLDREMLARERRRIPTYACGDQVCAYGGQTSAVRGLAPVRTLVGYSAVTATHAAASFPVKLDILWQVTTGAAKAGANRHLASLAKAVEILKPFQMDIVSSVTSPPDTPFPYEVSVDISNKSEMWSIRKAAGKARPASNSVYRIIVCAFDPSYSNEPKYYAETEGGTVEGDTFPAFTLINANVLRSDRCTVIHDMIHAADLRLTIADHDKDPANVFSGSDARSVLTSNYAEIISKAYFAKPK
jgi:hypothetical protein